MRNRPNAAHWAQTISPILMHTFRGVVCLSVTHLPHSCFLLKPFDRLKCYLTGGRGASDDISQEGKFGDRNPQLKHAAKPYRSYVASWRIQREVKVGRRLATALFRFLPNYFCPYSLLYQSMAPAIIPSAGGERHEYYRFRKVDF